MFQNTQKNFSTSPETDPLQRENGLQLLKISRRIQKLISDEKVSCCQSNPAVKVCLNRRCNEYNPFICQNEKTQCQCHSSHQDCEEKSLQSFLKIYAKEEKLIKTMEEMILAETDLLIDAISLQREKLLMKLSSMDWLWSEQVDFNLLSAKNESKDRANFTEYKFTHANTINSKVLSDMWAFHQQGLRVLNQGKIQEKIKKFSPPVLEQIEVFFRQIQHKIGDLRDNIVSCSSRGLFGEEYKQSKLQFDPFTFGSFCKIEGLKFTKEKPLFAVDPVGPTIGLLKPSLNEMKGSMIVWKIQAKKISKYISVGICDKQTATKITNKQSLIQGNHGLYMISSNKGVLWHGNRLNMSQSSFQFTTNDVIEMMYNKNFSTLTFQKQGSSKYFTMKIDEKEKRNKNGLNLYICFELGENGDGIEVVSPVLAENGGGGGKKGKGEGFYELILY